jgi:hypothetical protein
MGILIMLIIMAIVCLIGAVFLRIAAKLVDSLEVEFGDAYATVFIAALVCWAVGMIFRLIASGTPAIRFLSFPINLFAQAGVFSWRLSISFGKALLISLVMLVLWFVVWFIAGLLGLGIGSIVF